MSDEETDLGDITQLILIAGESSTGKSASLRNIRNQQNWMYLGTEAGKRLPFANKFDNYVITDPYQVHDAFEYAMDEGGDAEGIIVDSLTFLMDMFETQYVINAADGRAAWGDFQHFFKKMLQELVPKFGKPVIFTAHTRTDVDEATKTLKTAVPIKGALRGTGVEAYFSTVVASKILPLRDLKEYENDMLVITPDDELIEAKYVFQTRPTKKTTGERIRSPMGFFGVNETYIDNCAQQLLDHLNKMYNGE